MTAKGFSLVEVMVALGITGAIALGVMKISEQGSKAAKQTQSKFEIAQTQAEVISVLSNRTACTNTLGGAGVDLAGLIGGTSKSLPVIKSQNNTDFIGPFPTQRKDIRIESLVLSGWDDVDKIANAKVTYTYKMGPSSTTTRDFNFRVSFDMDPTQTNIMNGCVARAAQTSIDPKEICTSVVGLDSLGNAYWDGAQCEFARASCEKIGRTWNSVTSACDISAAEKLSIKKLECDERQGVLLQGTKMWHWNFSGALTYIPCTENHIKTNQQCFCKTQFRRKYSLGLSGTTETGGAGGQMKKINLQGWKFNVISDVFIVPNLIPNRPTGIRYTKITMSTGIENLSGTTRHYGGAIGCYSPSQSLSTDTSWVPDKNSSAFTSSYAAGNNYAFLIWMGFSSGGSYDGLITDVDSGGFLYPTIADSVREKTISITQTRPLAPGDKCVLEVYTHGSNHDVRVGGVGIHITQYTDDSQFSYDLEQ